MAVPLARSVLPCARSSRLRAPALGLRPCLELSAQPRLRLLAGLQLSAEPRLRLLGLGLGQPRLRLLELKLSAEPRLRQLGPGSPMQLLAEPRLRLVLRLWHFVQRPPLRRYANHSSHHRAMPIPSTHRAMPIPPHPPFFACRKASAWANTATGYLRAEKT